jgi:hypothetical protein
VNLAKAALRDTDYGEIETRVAFSKSARQVNLEFQKEEMVADTVRTI